MFIANIVGALLGIAFALIATLKLKPTSIVAFALFFIWTAAPFIGTLILTLKNKNQIGIGVAIYLTLLINLLFFIDIRYWHPDPQGAIAFLGLPVISAIIIALTMAAINKKKHNTSNQPGRS